jgi:hypothetical protein
MNQGFRHRPFRFASLAKLLGLAAFFGVRLFLFWQRLLSDISFVSCFGASTLVKIA